MEQSMHSGHSRQAGERRQILSSAFPAPHIALISLFSITEGFVERQQG